MKIIPGIIIILTIIIIILIHRIRIKKLKYKWPIIILRIGLPNVSLGFFGPIFLCYSTLLDCQDGHTYISTELKCRKGSWYVWHLPFVLIAIVFHFFIALITNTLYYKSIFDFSKSDVLKKTNSIPDISLVFTKSIIIILFILEQQDENGHWAFILLLMIVTGFNAYLQLYYKNRVNIMLMLLFL